MMALAGGNERGDPRYFSPSTTVQPERVFQAGRLSPNVMSIKNVGALALLFALCAASAWSQPLIISQIVDGEVWQTTIVLTNTTTTTGTASLSFFQETTLNATQPLSLIHISEPT